MVSATSLVYSTVVAPQSASFFIEKHFGMLYPLYIEPAVFHFATELSPDYQGGSWEYLSLTNYGFLMKPTVEQDFRVISPNGAEELVSAEAFGLTVCAFAFSNLSFSSSNGLAYLAGKHYHRLREYIAQSPESMKILRLID
jgi:hypothetical protein